MKYSVILPTKNGLPYLEYSCRSVLAESREDIELIVSVDSQDIQANGFLASINDPRLRILNPKEAMSMSEHWDYAQSQALGDWQMFLGQDDMLMRNYGEAFDAATELAISARTGVIVARRAYVAWPPLRDKRLKSLQYWATHDSVLRSSKDFISDALTTDISYHAGPQMYTTTLVSRKILNSIRSANGGRLILGHPQDAYLAAAILKESAEFLWLGSPFSWVGTSVKSAGLAITGGIDNRESKELAEQYALSVQSSRTLTYKSGADFRHGVNARYFYDALRVVWPEILEAHRLRGFAFKLRMDAGIIASIQVSRKAEGIATEVITSKQLRTLKTYLGHLFVLQRRLSSVLLRVVSLVLRPYLKIKYSFESSDYVADRQELFMKSRKIEAETVAEIRPARKRFKR